MSDAWVLVPAQPKWDQPTLNRLAAHTIGHPHPLYRAMLAARPPIPRATWDAMVERLRDTVLGSGHNAWVSDDAADAALRAALGQPLVEGDAP